MLKMHYKKTLHPFLSLLRTQRSVGFSVISTVQDLIEVKLQENKGKI